MKRLLRCWFLLILYSGEVFPQAPLWQWVGQLSSPDNELAWDVSVDPSSGNVYTCGSFDGTLNSMLGGGFGPAAMKDCFVVKYSPAGAIMWAIRIGGSGTDEIKSITNDPAGNVYITGYFEGTVDFNPGLGVFFMTSAGARDGFVAKLDASGNFIWAVKFGGGAADEGTKIFADANGVYLTGFYNSSQAVFYSTSSVTYSTAATQSLSNFFGARYSQGGVAQWVVSAGGNGADRGENVKADNGKVYFIGSYYSDLSVYNASATAVATLAAQTSNKSNVFILAYNLSGALAWSTNANSADDDVGFGLEVDNANVYISGGFLNATLSFPYPAPTFTLANQGASDIFLAAINKTAGTYTWISPATGSDAGYEMSTRLVKDFSGNLVMAGAFRDSLDYKNYGGQLVLSSGGDDVFISAYDPSGQYSWTSKGGGGNIDYPHGLATGTTGAVFVAGEYAGAALFGSINLVNFNGKNVFVGKTGCETVTNNTVTTSQTVCAGSSPAGFTGSLPSGGSGSYSYQWQQSGNSLTWTPVAGTNTNQNFSAPAANSPIYFRRVLTTGVSCMYPSNTLTVSVDGLPDISLAGTSQTLCSLSATLGANQPVTGQGTWSVIAGGATIAAAGSHSSTVSGLGVGNNIFSWSISNGVCPPSVSTVVIVRDAPPGLANAGTSQTLCAGSATLAAVTPSAGAGLWTVASGTATLNAPGSASSTVSGLSNGQNVFVWTISNGVCPASSASVTITRDLPPGAANAGPGQQVCSGTASLSANIPSVGAGLWTVVAGQATISSPGTPISQAGNLSIGQNIFAWTITNGVCPASSATVLIIRDAPPSAASAGNSQSVCAVTATLGAASPAVGTGSWSSAGGSASVAAAGNPASQVFSLAAGPNSFVWTVSNGVCPSSSDTVQITRDIPPGIAVAGSDTIVCANTVPLSAQQPTTGAGTWSVISGGSVISPSTSASAVASGLGTGKNIFAWTIVNGVCPPSTATVSVHRDALPDSSLAGVSQTVCTAGATLSANQPVSGTGTWSLIAGQGSVSAAGNPSAVVQSLATGQNVLAWTIVNGVCPPSVSTVSVTRLELPDQAVAGSDQTVCATTASIQANAPVKGTGAWSVVNGTAVVASPGSAVTTVSLLSTGNTILVWTISQGVCPPTSDTLIVFVPEAPSPANAGQDQRICGPTATLSATVPQAGTGQWTVLEGNATIALPVSAITVVTGLNTGKHRFIWQVSNANCPPTQDTVEVLVDAPPSAAQAGSSQQVCGTSATLGAGIPGTGTGSWSSLPGRQFSNAQDPGAIVSGLSEGENFLVWTVRSGVCEPSGDTVTVSASLLPSAADAGPDQVVCSPAATLAAVLPLRGKGSWRVMAGQAEFSDTTAAAGNIMVLTDSCRLAWTVRNGVCPASTDEMLIIRDTVTPVVTAGPDLDTEITSVVLLATATGSFAGSWQVLEGGGTLAQPDSARCAVNNLPEGRNVFRWLIRRGACADVADEVVVNVRPFMIPNALSPNNDGYNDTFYISALANYDHVKLRIFNRWGKLLYSDDRYLNNWSGTNSSGELLEDDTYYYILEIPDKKNYSGFVILKRNK